jgi:hypothetical protein
VSRTPTRRPLACVEVNTNMPRAQLSLHNFFSKAPKAHREPKQKTSTEHHVPDEPEYVPSDDDDFEGFLDDGDSPPPAKKRKLIVADTKARPRNKQTIKRPIVSSSSRASRQAADQSDLRPISSIPAMFDDMVSRAPDLAKVVDRLNGRKLRVATMCSGTESPLLALRMITRSLFKQTSKKLEIEHIFSCEIEPFKQAYIERNFAPPILFRDVLELANDYAYGHLIGIANIVTLHMEPRLQSQGTSTFSSLELPA